MRDMQAILEAINDFAPWRTAKEWDNPGLLVGTRKGAVKRIGVSLDITDETLAEAMRKECQCIVSHHPFLFAPIQKIHTDTGFGRRLKTILVNGINVIAAHTNWDVSSSGMNVILAGLLKLENIKPLVNGVCEDGTVWEGAIGTLLSAPGLDEFAIHLKEVFSLSWVRIFGFPGKAEQIAICGGSGGGIWKTALDSGADVFITSDMKYHDIQEAVDSGLAIALADHGEVERNSIPFLQKEIASRVEMEVIALQKHFDSGRTFV